jgi:predicted GH43/DUF377 family glycosyl hydrolase
MAKKIRSPRRNKKSPAKKNIFAVKKKKRAGKKSNKKTPKKNLLRKKSLPIKKRRYARTLTRSSENPIILPNKENEWEAWQTFNPGVILLQENVHFLYRAIGYDGISRLGYAASRNGYDINERLPYPAYEHTVQDKVFTVFSHFSGGSWGGAEDPRLTRVDNEDVLYMTYTACDHGLRVGLTSIHIDDFLAKRWRWTEPKLISQPNEVHKNWLIFPEKIHEKYAILHSLRPEIQIEYLDSMDFDATPHITSTYYGEPQKKCWDRWVRGAGAPPIKTRVGWLLFYHAMDADWSKYKVGAMLLDLTNPSIILHRAHEPVLEPEAMYERCGVKPGVVYVSGAVIKDGILMVYYGGADNYVCIAHADADDFLNALVTERRPKLSLKTLKTT